jgi:Trk K+ transport system NAD-binding subunit
MGMMGYRRRTSFLAGLTVAQISEFSLIVAALGLSLGHISNETMGLITLVGVVTIFVSTYMILYSGRLYQFLAEPLRVFERDDPFREAAIDSVIDARPVEVILVGLGNYGSGLAEYLLRRDKEILGADFDPGALEQWRQRGLPVVYGDITDPEMLEHLPLSKAMWVISTVRSKDMNMALFTNLKKHGFTGKVALTATTDTEADEFARAGAHLTFRPFKDATEQAADAIDSALDFLPERVDWPVAFSEVRIRSDASAAGQAIRDIPLSSTGITIIAVSRGGRVFYEPDPDFRVFPADRLLLMGPASELKEAESTLNQMEAPKNAEDTDRFEIAEIEVAGDSALAGKSLAEIRFRQRHGATLVGIRRGEEQITKINSDEQIAGRDYLIVIGKRDVVNSLKE